MSVHKKFQPIRSSHLAVYWWHIYIYIHNTIAECPITDFLYFWLMYGRLIAIYGSREFINIYLALFIHDRSKYEKFIKIWFLRFSSFGKTFFFKAFVSFDTNRDGRITVSELMQGKLHESMKEKKFIKNLDIKTLVKNSQFSEVLGQKCHWK